MQRENEYIIHASRYESCQASDIEMYLFLKIRKICIRCIPPRDIWTPEVGCLWHGLKQCDSFLNFYFRLKKFHLFQTCRFYMDCPKFIYTIYRNILTMGAVFLLLLCFLQGYSCTVQTFSELTYPIPRHRIQNLGRPVPDLSPSSFQCTKVSNIYHQDSNIFNIV